MKVILLLAVMHAFVCAAAAWHFRTGVQVKRASRGSDPSGIVVMAEKEKGKVAYLPEEYVDYKIQFPFSVWAYGIAGLTGLLIGLIWELWKAT